MGQHLSKVHKLDAQAVAKLLKKKTRAHPEAVKLKLPNPNKRRSGIQFLPLFVTKTTTEIPKTKDVKSSSGGFHSGGPFLEGFLAHLQTHAGGNRGKNPATQLTRCVGKYLYALNPDVINPSRGIWRTSNGGQGWEQVGYSIGCLPTWRLSST